MIHPVTIDDQAYIAPNWQEMGQLTVRLAEKIAASNGEFDRLIALAKGGLSWSRQLQDLLQIEDYSSIQVTMYEGVYQTKKSPIVIQSLPISIKGESVLVFDDVADSGETLALAKEYFGLHGATNVKTATHFTKPWTKLTPDFTVENTDSWIIFPHDTIEMIHLLKDKWHLENNEEFYKRLQKIGIEPAIIDFSLKHL